MPESHRSKFIKLLHQASQRFDLWDVFNDFLLVAATSIANTADLHHAVTPVEEWNKREKRYLETIGKYSEDERSLFLQMFAELVEETDSHAKAKHFEDVLGGMFHELNLQSQWRNQFFTPQDICDLMGKMVADKETMRQRIEAVGYVSVNEPCCGAGAMIYGFVNAMREYGFNHSKDCLIYAGDLDERCVWMTYIQCSLYGMPAVIRQQNTLTGEQFGSPWYTPVYIFGLWRWKEAGSNRR